MAQPTDAFRVNGAPNKMRSGQSRSRQVFVPGRWRSRQAGKPGAQRVDGSATTNHRHLRAPSATADPLQRIKKRGTPQGARRVVLAGRPGDRLEAYQRAGVDDFVYLGCDAVAALTAALDAGGES